MVDIYLIVPNKGSQVLALSIPSSDIQRLSIRPLKWLRFVTFAVCGVPGNLSATPDGPAVEYDSIPHAEIAEAYYYTPQGEPSWFSSFSLVASDWFCVEIGDYHLVDYKASNDRITSSLQTARRGRFRNDVMERDGSFCVFTGVSAELCDAAHIVSRRKGNEVPFKIVLCNPLTKPPSPVHLRNYRRSSQFV